MDESHEPSRRAAATTTCLGLAAIVVLAAWLRLEHLGRESLWVDEGLTARLIELPLPRLIPEMRKIEQFPPLYHLIMHGWVRFVRATSIGDARSDVMLRLPSALFGTAAVVIAFILGRRLFGTGAALAAALLLAVSPIQIDHARDARGYSLFVLLGLLACERFTAIVLRSPEQRRSTLIDVVVLGLFMALMMYAHLYGATVVAAQACVLLVLLITRGSDDPSTRAALRTWLLAMLLAALLFAPWAWVLMNKQPGHIGYRPAWLPPPSLALLREMLVSYGGSRPLATGLLLLACLGAIAWARTRSFGLMLCASLILTGVVLPWFASATLKPVFIPRYGLVAQVALLMLAGAGVAWFCSRIVTGSVVVLLLISSFAVIPRAHRTNADWRGLVATVARQATVSDVVLSRWFGSFVFEHYLARHVVDVPLLNVDMIPRDELLSRIRGRTVWWVIETDAASVPPEAYDVPPGHRVAETLHFHGLEVRWLVPDVP